MEVYELRRGPYKNLTLRLIPPDGHLRVSAPWYVPRVLIDRFVAARTGWIAEKRRLIVPAPQLSSEVGVWGVPHRIRVESPGRLPRVVLDEAAREVVLRVPASWPSSRYEVWLNRWEKERLSAALEALVPFWSGRTGLKVDRWTVKTLKSRWGSCRPDTRALVFNSRLAALPLGCLEYVVVHEIAHLVVAHHGPEFHALVESWLPGATRARKLLRACPFETNGPGVSGGPPARPGEETEL